MKKYYLYNGARQYGPFSFAELKHQHLLRDTPVWYEGLNEWVKAGSVEELQEILPPATPPPFVVSNSSQGTTITSLPSTTTASHLKARFLNKVLLIAGILVLLLLALIIAVIGLR